jgi:Ca2+-binding RTX toxin-like protein
MSHPTSNELRPTTTARGFGRLRLFAVLAALFAWGLIGAAAAGAATVSMSFDSPSQGTLIYQAGDGETNHVTVEMASDLSNWLVTETGASLTAGAGCTTVDAQSVTCPAPQPDPSSNSVSNRVAVALGDMQDWASGATACFFREVEPFASCELSIDGGDGDDEVIGNDDSDTVSELRGGEGADVLVGGDAGSRLWGGAGDDLLQGSPSTLSSLDGGTGADTIVGNGPYDKVVYTDRVRRVFVSLNGRRDDGEAGENDLVLDVENVVTGSGADVIVGDSHANLILAGNGNDLVLAGAGRDRIFADVCYPPDEEPFADRIYGQDGADDLWGCGGNDLLGGGPGPDYLEAGTGLDRVSGADGSDRIYGDAGGDALFGGNGADEVVGGTGRDAIAGGLGRDILAGFAGSDIFYARDGYRDRVRGGEGHDRARVDRRLDVRTSIERLF